MSWAVIRRMIGQERRNSLRRSRSKCLWSGPAASKTKSMRKVKPTKVGPYDALYFETLMTIRDGSTIRWRQWVFMVDNRCYFVVSTILPQLESQILPDVRAMVASFRIKKTAEKPIVTIVEAASTELGDLLF